MHQVNQDLGELISAIGMPWFENTLPAVLQSVFNYDYFLLAGYEKNKSLSVISSDFQDVEMQQTLYYLETETHVAEPIFRLFNAGKTKAGIFDMSDLTFQSHGLSKPMDLSSPYLMVDEKEEMGWRTIGWPEYQQETCILVPIDEVKLVAVSMYNFGLISSAPSRQDRLRLVYPIINSAMMRHFQLYPGNNKQHGSLLNSNDVRINTGISILSGDVSRFFESGFNVSITAREAEIFSHLFQGETLAAIAENLCISVYTARTHRRNVYRKIGHGRLLELINRFHTQVNENHLSSA